MENKNKNKKQKMTNQNRKIKNLILRTKNEKQAGAELCQAQY